MEIKPIPFNETARTRLNMFQMYVLTAILFFVLGLLFVSWHNFLIFITCAITIMYFTDLLFNFFLIYRSFSKKPEVTIAKHELEERKVWPTYTILCPLYKEKDVLPQFTKAMSNLDYPKNKLQVLLLLEQDDVDTIDAARNMSLPAYFQIVVVPHSQPKTKPKACNYGLQFATGSRIVIYDAEDVPDKDQLKKAVIAFDKLNGNTVCIQAKLNFYNPNQNLLTRLFTAEYSLWFDMILTGLQSLNAPIPLGGTSNHFKTRELMRLGAWDEYNVTEDADLGIRISKHGYRTAILDSTTYEEANPSPKNWINQRSRWIKGYIQTYFVHTRPFNKERLSFKNLLIFNVVVGGKIASILINPIMWLMTISYFVLRPFVGHFIESLFPAPIFYIALLSLVAGNFLYFYYHLIGCMKRGYGEMLKYLFLIPFYWIFMSYVSYISIYQFIRKPHYWEKTVHGLHATNLNYLFAVDKEPIEIHAKPR